MDLNTWLRISGQHKIKVGISSCVLGFRVRYDGGHKRECAIVPYLSRFFEFVPVCPEVESGLSVPREPIQLKRMNGGRIRAVGLKNPRYDVTSRLRGFSHARMPSLAALAGFIVKNKSPSCGLESVPIYAGSSPETASGSGIFTTLLIKYYPLLPVEEEQRLRDIQVRHNFILRVLVYSGWRELLESSPNAAKLTEFHRSLRPLLMDHNPSLCLKLDLEVAAVLMEDLEITLVSYGKILMGALNRDSNRFDLKKIRADHWSFKPAYSIRFGRIPSD